MLYTELQAALSELGMKQVQLARLLGVNKQSIFRWVKGTREIPKYVETILSILMRYSDMDTTPYEYEPHHVLGIRKTASEEEAKEARKKLLFKLHPDLQGSHEETVKVIAAYREFLNEPHIKKSKNKKTRNKTK